MRGLAVLLETSHETVVTRIDPQRDPAGPANSEHAPEWARKLAGQCEAGLAGVAG